MGVKITTWVARCFWIPTSSIFHDHFVLVVKKGGQGALAEPVVIRVFCWRHRHASAGGGRPACVLTSCPGWPRRRAHWFVDGRPNQRPTQAVGAEADRLAEKPDRARRRPGIYLGPAWQLIDQMRPARPALERDNGSRPAEVLPPGGRASARGGAWRRHRPSPTIRPRRARVVSRAGRRPSARPCPGRHQWRRCRAQARARQASGVGDLARRLVALGDLAPATARLASRYEGEVVAGPAGLARHGLAADGDRPRDRRPAGGVTGAPGAPDRAGSRTPAWTPVPAGAAEHRGECPSSCCGPTRWRGAATLALQMRAIVGKGTDTRTPLFAEDMRSSSSALY